VHSSYSKKISYAILLGSTVLTQLFTPVSFVSAAIPGLGDIAGGAQCGIPPTPTGQEVPVADKTVRSATKITCTNTAKQTLKEYVLDTLAYIAVHTILRAMTNMILGWIQGTDADFVQNLEDEFTRTADAEAGMLLNEITGLNLCGNIGAFLKLSIGVPSTQRNFRQRMTCTATQAVNNIEGFYRNFSQGGWNAFFKIALEPQNNAYGAFMLTLNEQAQRTDNKQVSLQQRLLEGSGFMGFSTPRDTNCQRVSAQDAATLTEDLKTQQQVWGKENKPEQSIKADNADPENPTFSFCDVTYDTKTPGSLFSAALPEAVFSDLRRAQIADELNESIAQIVTALLNKVIEASSGSGKGILESREVRQMPPVTPADTGFTPTYLTNKAEDGILRLQTAQSQLDSRIQSLDAQIDAINKQITDYQNKLDELKAACSDSSPDTVCDWTAINNTQTNINNFKTQKNTLIQERTRKLSLLQRTDQDIKSIFDLRAQIVATSNIDQIQVLDTRLTNVLSDAEAIIIEGEGAPPGLAGADPNTNLVSSANRAQQHAGSVIAWLEKKIGDPAYAGQKSQLESARDVLVKLRDEIGTLRTDFLTAVSSGSGITQALGRLTAKINETNTTCTTDYDRFRAL